METTESHSKIFNTCIVKHNIKKVLTFLIFFNLLVMAEIVQGILYVVPRYYNITE